MPVLGAPALIYWPQHKGLRAVLATMIAEMRRFDAGSRGQNFKHASCFIPAHARFFCNQGKSVLRAAGSFQ
jgi:hypothetical protein